MDRAEGWSNHVLTRALVTVMASESTPLNRGTLVVAATVMSAVLYVVREDCFEIETAVAALPKNENKETAVTTNCASYTRALPVGPKHKPRGVGWRYLRQLRSQLRNHSLDEEVAELNSLEALLRRGYGVEDSASGLSGKHPMIIGSGTRQGKGARGIRIYNVCSQSTAS